MVYGLWFYNSFLTKKRQKLQTSNYKLPIFAAQKRKK